MDSASICVFAAQNMPHTKVFNFDISWHQQWHMIRWAWTKSSKTPRTVVSSISKKSLGQGGSSDTNHIILGYADKFVEGVLSAASVEGGMQMRNSAMGCCCRVQSLFLPWWDVAFGIEYNYKVSHCSNGNILDLNYCKKHCLLWVSSIHVHIEEKGHPVTHTNRRATSSLQSPLFILLEWHECTKSMYFYS